jgi:AmmeMemoRadiSam system protein B
MTESEEIRKAAVAGYFYPRGPEELAREIDGMIDEAAPPPVPEGSVGRVLVSPHAGYRYSGRVAASGFKSVRGQDVHTVVVISPSHIEPFGYSAVYDGAGYETPLGVAEISREYSDRLASANNLVIKSARGHEQLKLPRQEHALEVQVPFIQRTFGRVRLVAVVMGSQSWDNCAALGEALAPFAGDPGVLVVASTDLSHFHDSDTADRLDGRFRDVLATLDARALFETVKTGEGEACGAGPVTASLLATESLGGRACTVLDQKNSGDVSGDYSSVVGYLSAVVTARNPE